MTLVLGSVLGSLLIAAIFLLLPFLRAEVGQRRYEGPRRTDSRAVIRGRRVSFDEDGRHAEIAVEQLFIDLSTRPSFGSEGTRTGDPAFDADFVLQGADRDVQGLLDEAFRNRISRLFSKVRMQLRDGSLRLEPSSSFTGEIARLVSDSVVLLEDLERAKGTPLASRLLQRATGDSVAGVRRLALLELLRAFPDSPEAAEARTHAASDASPDVRRLVLGEVDGAIAIADESARGNLSAVSGAGAVSLKK